MSLMFDPEWATHHRDSVRSTELCRVRVTRSEGGGSWSPETGVVPAAEVVVYEGTARWQKSGRTTKRDFVEDSAHFSGVKVQISFEGFDEFQMFTTFPEGFNRNFQPNDKVVLLENASNPHSVGDVVYVWGDPTSSNAWHHTLYCQQNLKQVG